MDTIQIVYDASGEAYMAVYADGSIKSYANVHGSTVEEILRDLGFNVETYEVDDAFELPIDFDHIEKDQNLKRLSR